MDKILFAFGLTLFAGMATGIGSLIAFTAKPNHRFLSIATGFSAGVMLYVSFVEILVKGETALSAAFGSAAGGWLNTASFFGGMLLIGLIDNLIPGAENPHEVHSDEETACLSCPLPRNEKPEPKGKLMRMGLFTAMAITIHNFPEGMATFLSAIHDPSIGLAVAIAIALHNIPEGVSVSVPIYYATGKRRKALFYSILSGMAEPVGAVVGYLLIKVFFNGGGAFAVSPAVMGVSFGAVAGIMVYISLDELLPTSRAYGTGHDSLLGLAGGMLVMAASLLLLR